MSVVLVAKPEAAGSAEGTNSIVRWMPNEWQVSGGAGDTLNGNYSVELARSGRRIVVPPYRSLLDMLEENGCKVTNSCRAGICGTCLIKVLAGIPEHNDDVLSIEEQESGK